MGQASADTAILGKKERELLAQHMAVGERVEFCLVGASNQALVVLDDRVLILKTGFLAGAAFGGRAAAFHLSDISGIQVNTGLINGSIEIHTPGLGATKAGDFFTTDAKSDPFKLPNCIPIAKVDLKLFQPYLDRLRAKIAIARDPGRPKTDQASQGGPDIASQLAKLGELHSSGLLSPEEFAAAKKLVLGTG